MGLAGDTGLKYFEVCGPLNSKNNSRTENGGDVFFGTLRFILSIVKKKPGLHLLMVGMFEEVEHGIEANFLRTA